MWIGVDLDGTLAHYDGWVSHIDIGEPILPMVNRVQEWLVDGHNVKIFTARISSPSALENTEAIVAIRNWCRDHIGVALEVTNVKDFDMAELWDDRAVQVIANTGEPVGQSTRGL